MDLLHLALLSLVLGATGPVWCADSAPSNDDLCSAIDCSNGELQLIPGDAEKCDSGVYCECDASGVARNQTCPVELAWQSKFNPETKTCEVGFDCSAWLEKTYGDEVCGTVVCGAQEKQLIPGDEDKCETGVYCECDSAGVAHKQTCPLPGAKLNPDTQDCEFDFNCSDWKEEGADPTAAATAPPELNLCEDVDCRNGALQLIPGDVEKCESGVYCECDASGKAFNTTCPAQEVFHSRFNPETAACETEFSCSDWMLGSQSKPPNGVTPLPENVCAAVNCRAGNQQLVPGDAEKCESGVYCECDASGVARNQTCPVELAWQSKFNPDTKTCEVGFDCSAWLGETYGDEVCGTVVCGAQEKQLIPGDEDKCETGVYCECDSAGVAHKQTCPLPGAKLNPDKQDCEFVFECGQWLGEHPVTPPVKYPTEEPPLYLGGYDSAYYLIPILVVSLCVVVLVLLVKLLLIDRKRALRNSVKHTFPNWLTSEKSNREFFE